MAAEMHYAILSRRRLLAGLAGAACLPAVPAAAAPRPRPWPHWEIHNPSSLARLDHAPLERLLARYLHTSDGPLGADSLFDYGGVTAEHRGELDAYVAGLARVPITQYRRAEQLAYWVNLYNALVLQQVLVAYPVASIRDVDLSGAFFLGGPWAEKLVTVERFDLSLDDIQHRILRPGWRDPRLHYVLNCAALGCPHLQPRAFAAGDAEARLEAAATAFVNHPRTLQMRFEGLQISSLYVWYADDFGYGRSAVMRHLRRYATGRRAALLRGLEGWSGHSYDWRLNDRALFAAG